jgi:hypothetical protein
MKHSKETKIKISQSMSKYLKEHPEHISLHYWEGKKMSKKTKQKMRISAKKSINLGRFKKGSKPWNKNKQLPEELKKRISKTLENHRMSKMTRLKISKSNKGKLIAKTNQIAYIRILKEIPELEKQGFRCFPIGKIIPDIIAIKNNRIYAIEVEYAKSPNYKKYENQDIYDEIIWILKHPHARKY